MPAFGKGGVVVEVRSRGVHVVNVVVTLLLMAAPYVIPLPDALSDVGAKILGVLIGCTYGWITVGIVGTSFLGLVMLGFAQDLPVSAVFQEGFGGETFLLVFFFAAFAGILEQVGLGEWIASWVLNKRFTRKGPWMLSFALLLMSYLVSFVTSIMPGILISWGVLSGVCALCGLTKENAWPRWMAVGIVLACCMGHSAWPIEVLSFTLLGLYQSFDLPSIGYVPFTILNVSIGLMAIVGYVLACRVVLRPEVGKLDAVLAEGRECPSLTKEQRQIVVVAVLFFAVLFVPGAFPDAGGVVGFLGDIGTSGCAAAVLALAAIVRRSNGSSLVDVASAIRDGVPWESLILVACAIPLSSALTSDEAGLQPLFSGMFSALFSDLGGGLAFSVCFVVLVVALTNVMGNMTVGIISVSLLCSFAPAIGANAPMLTVIACIACNAALLLPSGGPTAALLHGNKEWFSVSREVYAPAGVAVGSFFASACVSMVSIGPLLF